MEITRDNYEQLELVKNETAEFKWTDQACKTSIKIVDKTAAIKLGDLL